MVSGGLRQSPRGVAGKNRHRQNYKSIWCSPAQLESARGQLTPFLRDTLVGLNYAYYEPPGAEILHNNPLFVRSHDFSSVSVRGTEQVWGPPGLIGVGATAGGGAFLIGSLADLPYALASTEQDFISPKNVQALVWKETAPGLLVSAILPRWWTVSRSELHSAALYQTRRRRTFHGFGNKRGTAGRSNQHSLRSHDAGPTGIGQPGFAKSGNRHSIGFPGTSGRHVLSRCRIPEETS